MIPLLAALTTAAAMGDPSYLAQLQAEAKEKRLAKTRQWTVLGHYRNRLVGKKSQADGRGFFTAKGGKRRPERELLSTLETFFYDLPDDEEVQHPQCQFRARYHWLKQELDFDVERLPEAPCDRYDKWSASLDVESVSLIFADAYLNNPASMFGHTFLRLNRKSMKGGGADLLANTINFAAEPWTENPLIYPIMGIFGGFVGDYTTSPYYMKVQEYNDMEHRALWEYPLDLTSDELAQMKRHLWEMGSTHFMYWYFDENCSYQLLSLIEAAKPELKLTNQFPLWVLPSSTLRVMLDHGNVSKDGPVYRHSQYEQMMARKSQLVGDEPKVARDIASGKLGLAAIAALPEERRAKVLDAAIERLKYMTDLSDPKQELAQRAHTLNTARGKIPIASSELDIAEPAAPETAHRPEMVGAGAAVNAETEKGYYQLDIRPSLRDLASPVDGYIRGTTLELAAVTLRLPMDDPDPSKIILERFHFFHAQSNLPMNAWAPRMSWRFRTGFTQFKDGGCAPPDCLYYEALGGPGLTVGADRATAFAFADIKIGAGQIYTEGPIGAELGGTLGFLVEPIRPWRAWLELSNINPVYGRKFSTAGAEYFGDLPIHGKLVNSVRLWRDGEVRLNGIHGPGYTEGVGSFQFYF